MAEAWARRLLEERYVMADVRSAGTHAWDDALAGADTTDAMRELGFDLRPHRSTRVTPALLAWADLVAVMEPMHADVLLQHDPSVEAKLRRMWTYLPGNPDHVEDPIGQELEAHRRAAQSVGDAVRALVDEWFARRQAALS